MWCSIFKELIKLAERRWIIINKIVSGISLALQEEFGDCYAIYKEKVTQGFSEPCFVVTALSPRVEHVMGNRYFRRNPFCISYYPKSSVDAVADCNDAAERLTDALEYIDVGEDLTRGSKMQYEVKDEILSFFVNYDFYAYKQPAAVDEMGDITIEREVYNE